MPNLIRLGNTVINLDHVCRVVREDDGKLTLVFSYFTYPPAIGRGIPGPAGMMLFEGVQANRLWRHLCETAGRDLMASVSAADEAVPAVPIAPSDKPLAQD